MQQLKSKYKTAFVTGGSSGLGAEFVKMLLGEGLDVWTTSRKITNIKECPGLHRKVLDLSDFQSITDVGRDIIKEVPDLDIVINNAGSADFGSFEQCDSDAINRQLNVMLYGPIQLSHIFFKYFRARGHGTIVNITSLAATFPIPYMSIYNTAKAGLASFTRSLELEAGHNSGITIINFEPGDYQTAFNDSMKMGNSYSNETNPRALRAWQQIDKHMASSPHPEHAARKLKKALERGVSCTVTSGSFTQALLAPFLSRFGTWPIIRFALEQYYDLK